MADAMTPDFAAAEQCAKHIVKISAHPEYRDSWLGGESRLARAYLALRAEVAALREDKAQLEDALEEIRDSDDPRWYDLAARALTRLQPEPR